MIYLQVILTIFSILLLTTIILGVIWWKKYGKSLFSTLKDLKNMQNPSNFTKNLNNLGNLEDFYKNIGNFGGQMGGIDNKMANFNQRMGEIAKKMGKK